MDYEDILKKLQTEADRELSKMETFSPEMGEKIKSEFERISNELDERRRREEQS